MGAGSENNDANGPNSGPKPASASDEQAPKRDFSLPSSTGRSSPFGSSSVGAGKASIPAWQLAMANKSGSSSSAPIAANGTEAGSSGAENEASS